MTLSSDQALTVKTLWQALTRVLQEGGMDTPVADARLLIQEVMQMTREQMLTTGERPVTETEREGIEKLMARRLKHEPVSRILGRRSFWKHDFIITPATLDPRPDSETVIMAALAHATSPASLLDLGTGSGCLLLSLLGEWTDAQGMGIDISVDAVKVAGENARALNLSRRATFVAMDWGKFNGGPFDVIVANPPYIGTRETKDLAPDVVLYDPPQALFAGEEGLDAYRVLAPLVSRWLAPRGIAVFEIGHTQAGAVSDILASGGMDVLETRQDLGGSDRVIVAKKP